ncbi:MAG TPA: aminoglycoside phosphotransferase family protein [Ktedonobacterales bacterium]|nr:aminoglycoside phosphotransferase family protein [Ktedonobacterales bacterium]
MLTPPDIASDTIIAFLGEYYALRAQQVTFLPIGADANAAVFRVDTDGDIPYFLKLKRGDFDEIAVSIPAYLRAHGIPRVMAPLATTARQLWASGHGFTWILYPYFEGENGFRSPLSDAQWVTLGQSLRAVHASLLPPELASRVPREDYAPRWRDIVVNYDRQVEARLYDDTDDPFARRLAAFWRTRRDEIHAMVERAEQLGRMLQQRTIAADGFVLCHTDLHAGNVLLSAGNKLELAIVDWDAPIYAPTERDLMFIGGGIGGIWDSSREEALFYQGYGATDIDPVALSYYRYERIVEDLAAYGEQIFEALGSVEDREYGLVGTIGQFDPGRVVTIAHRTYERVR